MGLMLLVLVLTIEWGGATAGGDIMEFTVPAESGLYLVVPGLIIVGAATALVVAAFAATTSAINIFGYVNRITA
jgi:Na+/alanine symporter